MTNKDCDLVITIASHDEAPIEWLEGIGVEVIKARKLSSHKGKSDLSVLVVITGIGVKNSTRAAREIIEHLNPNYVVNLGAAGACNSRNREHSWVRPNEVRNEDGESITLPNHFPFYWPKEFLIANGATLSTLKEPLLGDRAAPHSADIVDMEAYNQAKLFGDADISFHCAKFITDDGQDDAKRQYKESLSLLRDQMAKVLAFLEKHDEPEISVIIPVHNREDFIVECVDSVLAQSLAPKEIIVIDDGSTDGTANRLKSYGDKIKVIKLDKNMGVSYARNLGAKNSSGRWLAFLDSDDYWTTDKLERQRDYLRRRPHYRIAQSEEIWYRNGRRINPRNHHKKRSGYIFKPSLGLCLISPSTVIMDRDLFNEHNGFDEALPACEDYDFWLRITRNNVVGLDPSPTTIKRGGHADQLSTRYPAIDRFRVSALQKALLNEEDETLRDAILKTLNTKLKILVDGAKKRDNEKWAKQYESELAQLSDI